MNTLLPILIGGAAGALGRWWLTGAVHAWLGRGFPYGTLAVNVLGCLAMGILYVLLVERGEAPAEWRGVLLVGFLGAFTTFSSFSLETVALLEDGQLVKAAANTLFSVVLCLLATWVGMAASRQVI